MSDVAADDSVAEPARADAEEGGAEASSRAAPEDGAEEAPRPAKKRKKKKRKAAAAREGVPAFAQGFPPDPELDRLLAAFERGDYALVRVDARRLAEASPDDEVRRAARELLERIAPDPLAVLMITAAVALLVFLSAWYWSHAHPTP